MRNPGERPSRSGRRPHLVPSVRPLPRAETRRQQRARSPLAPARLLRFVRLSSERVRQAVRQDCSFAEKQEFLPALLVVVPSERRTTRRADACSSRTAAREERRIQGIRSWSSRLRPRSETLLADPIESKVECEAGPAANNPGPRAVLRRHAPSATRQRTLEANGIDCGAGPFSKQWWAQADSAE